MEKDKYLLWDYHLHYIILNGVWVNGESSHYADLKNCTTIRFKRFNFTFAGHRYDTFQAEQGQTPYALKNNLLYYQDESLEHLPFERIVGIDDIWGSERNWYFKRIYNQPEFHELRLNPVNSCANIRYKTGYSAEFRGCAFCHRVYSHSRQVEQRRIVKPQQIFSEIFTKHGIDVVRHIRKVLVITGDTRKEEQLLELAEEIYNHFPLSNHFRGTFSLATNIIRTEEYIRRLAHLDNTLFEFPVECFSRRQEILGEKKGIPLAEIGEIFSLARKYFKYIRINYIIGIDDLESATEGFRFLLDNHLIDDIIPNILTPFTPEMMTLRHSDAHTIDYLHAFREMFKSMGLRPKRTGITKNLFSDFSKSVTFDELAIPQAGQLNL